MRLCGSPLILMTLPSKPKVFSLLAICGTASKKKMNSHQEKRNLKSNNLEAAKYDALKLLTYKSRTRSELSRRLALKGYDDRTVEKTLAYLETIGLLDDLKWANDRINYCLQKGYGIIGIKNVLREKGIDRQLAETALESLNLEIETEACLQFFGKKYKPPFDVKTKRRVLDALRRRGFSNEAINSVLKNVQKRNQNSDEK